MIRHRVIRANMKDTPEDEALQINEWTRGQGHGWRLVCISVLGVNYDGMLAQYTFEEVSND